MWVCIRCPQAALNTPTHFFVVTDETSLLRGRSCLALFISCRSRHGFKEKAIQLEGTTTL